MIQMQLISASQDWQQFLKRSIQIPQHVNNPGVSIFTQSYPIRNANM